LIKANLIIIFRRVRRDLSPNLRHRVFHTFAPLPIFALIFSLFYNFFAYKHNIITRYSLSLGEDVMTEIKIGRYEIRNELGEGGMGTVYLAYDPTLGREVALKVLHPHLFSHDPAFSLRFEQEARTIAALEHSHIVPLYEFGEDSNGLYFVMRLMKGGTLRDKLTQGLLTLEETIAILERIGSALDKAHRSGIIHRDLKPGNILFDEDGNTFLGDFGIVKTEDADRLKTRTGQSLGTPH
jgi:serine/threonine protein kinase